MIYFDQSATTPLHPEVAQSVYEVMTRYYGNPSSLHRLGVEADQLLSRAREQIARLLHVPEQTIVFTSGGSESNNLAIKGAASALKHRGKHLITSAVEHPSVYEACMQLQQTGYTVTVLSVDKHGRVDPAKIREALRDDTVLVSIMLVNNEIGALQPIRDIAQILNEHPKVLFHVDAIQAVGKLPVLPEQLGVDLLSASAHKFYGPKGVGLLYKRDGVQLEPLISGGGQEGGARSGTENVPYIVGMAKALRLAIDSQRAAWPHVSRLRDKLLQSIADIPELVVNSPPDPEDGVPHIVNISCIGMKSEVIVHALEQRGCYISSRSACSSREDKPSRVLLALGMSEDRARSGLRISLAADHTDADVDQLGSALRAVVAELKRVHR